MKHSASTDELTELAASHALGMLSAKEAEAFENHLAEDCDICRAELESFASTVSALGLGISELQPGLKVRDKLVARLNEDLTVQADAHQFVSIRADEGDWQQLLDGVLMKRLHFDRATGLATSLVRMLPGASLPAHQHGGVEQIFVIEGDCYVHSEKLGPGDYHRAEAGSLHESTYTLEGTMFLLVAPVRYEMQGSQGTRN